MDSKCQDPASASECALRRHSSKVGAVCSNPARTDLCGGRWATGVPTATKRPLKVLSKFFDVVIRCCRTQSDLVGRPGGRSYGHPESPGGSFRQAGPADFAFVPGYKPLPRR